MHPISPGTNALRPVTAAWVLGYPATPHPATPPPGFPAFWTASACSLPVSRTSRRHAFLPPALLPASARRSRAFAYR